MNTRPRNISKISEPYWMKDDYTDEIRPDQIVLVISRGEPRRTDDQMHTGVTQQVRAWCQKYESDTSDEVVQLAAASIATEQVYPLGSQSVRVTLRGLEWHLKRARKQANK